MREVGWNDRSRDAVLARTLIVFFPAVRIKRVQCKAKLCWDEKELFLVAAVHQPVSNSSADPVLRKETILPVRLRTEEADLVAKAVEENEGRVRDEWLQCAPKPFGTVQDALRKANLVRPPHLLRV